MLLLIRNCQHLASPSFAGSGATKTGIRSRTRTAGAWADVRLLRVAQIQQELQLLDGTIEKGFVSQDRTFAAMSDFQGMGGRGRTAWPSVVPYSANSLFQLQASSRRNAQGIHEPKDWQK
jgi:hypothetical protein